MQQTELSSIGGRDRLANLKFAALLVVVLGALLAPSILGHKRVSSADLLAHHQPWRDSSLAGVEPVGEHSDPVFYFEPWTRFAVDSLEHDGPPQRNPLSSLGVPFLGNAQSALYSPFTLPYYLLPEETASWVSVFLKLFLAGLGAFLLARTYGRSTFAASVAGLGYTGCGFLVLWLSYPLSSALVPLPWTLAAVRWLHDRPRAAVYTLAFGIATAVLGGHPECAFHTGALTLVAFLAEAWTRRHEAPGTPRLLIRFTMGCAAGGLIAAPQILPFLDSLVGSGALEVRSDPVFRSLRLSHPPPIESVPMVALCLLALVGGVISLRVLLGRVSLGPSGPLGRTLPGDSLTVITAGGAFATFVYASLRCGAWNGLPLLVAPHYFGRSDHDAGEALYTGPVNYAELNGGYLGAALLVLALLAPALAGRGTRVRGKMTAFLVLLFVSLDIPPFSQLLSLVPPFDVVVNRRLLGATALFGALLAADSVDGLTRLDGARRRATLGFLVALALTTLGIAFVNDPGRLPTRSGTGDMLERLSVPPGSPCAALAHPRPRATVQGDQLEVSGYLVSLTEIDEARVRLVHRKTGAVAEGTAQIGLSEPTPRHDAISKFPDAHRSGFETVLDLAGFPGGDADIELWLPASEASLAPLVKYRVRVVRPHGLGRAWWTLPLTLLAILLALSPWASTFLGWVGRAAILGIAFADLGSFAHQHIPQIDPAHHYPDFPELDALRTEHGRVLPAAGAQEVLRPNAHMAYGLAVVEGVDGLGDRRATRMLDSVRDQARDRTPLGNALRINVQNPLFPLLGVERILVPRDVPVDRTEARTILETDHHKVLEPVRSGIRARMYTRWRRRAEGVSAGETLLASEQRVEDVLIFGPEVGVGPSEPWPKDAPMARMLFDHPHEISVEVEPGPAGWLLITDLYSPHFEAEVDGAPVQIKEGFDHLLAAWVPEGEETRQVRFLFRPWTTRTGWVLAWLGMVLLAVTVLCLSLPQLAAQRRGRHTPEQLTR